MKAACSAVIGLLALFSSACVTGDEITSYVIDPDGSTSFSIYRLNLTSDQKGEEAKRDLSSYIQELEWKRGNLFTNLVKANADEIKVAILRRGTPASVLITGRFPTLNDFASYISEEDEESSLVCTPVFRESTRGISCKSIPKLLKEKTSPEPAKPRADSFSEMRIALAEGSFTEAQGFLISRDRRSALFDDDALSTMVNQGITPITFMLEWQIPEE
jgi:hypothetical protein